MGAASHTISESRAAAHRPLKVDTHHGPQPVRVLTHPRWRHVRIRVDAVGITLTAPTRTTRRVMEAALRHHRDWIDGQLAHPAPAAATVTRRQRDAARQVLVPLVEQWAPRIGVTPARVTIRNPRTRWGSASARGTISLHWCLAHAPREVAEYVVVHELCHLREMNHSPRFWALVAEHIPDHRRHRDWLAQHGGELRQRAQ